MEIKHAPVIYPQKNMERITDQAAEVSAQPKLETNEMLEKITKEMLTDKVEEMNGFLETTSTALKFKLHEKLQIYYVQVIDANTEEVLKEIPNKKFLDMYASMAEIAGLLVDEKR